MVSLCLSHLYSNVVASGTMTAYGVGILESIGNRKHPGLESIDQKFMFMFELIRFTKVF